MAISGGELEASAGDAGDDILIVSSAVTSCFGGSGIDQASLRPTPMAPLSISSTPVGDGFAEIENAWQRAKAETALPATPAPTSSRAPAMTTNSTKAGGGSDVLRGGAGADQLNGGERRWQRHRQLLATAPSASQSTLRPVPATAATPRAISLSGFEILSGSQGNDHLDWRRSSPTPCRAGMATTCSRVAIGQGCADRWRRSRPLRLLDDR